MLTVACTLTFPDGRELTGRIEARSPGVPYSILYSGVCERLTLRLEKGTAWDLELLFKLAAYRSEAALAVEKSGEYESRTDLIDRDWA
jgi:hypothetical protein